MTASRSLSSSASSTTRTRRWIIGGGFVVLLGLAYAWHRRQASAGPANTAPAETTAAVSVAPIEQRQITATTTAYGLVVVRPGRSDTLTLPFEVVVDHVLVAPGESVTTHQPVVAISASPATRLKIGQAKATLDSADVDLRQTQQRFDLNLATNAELSQAHKAADTARLEWENLAEMNTLTQLTSVRPGVVGKIWAQNGQFIGAGQPFIELIPVDQIEAKLDVEASDANQLRVGETVTLTSIHNPGAKPTEGKIRLVTQRLNPDTRLVEVFITPAAGSALRLDDYLRADLPIASSNGLIVPRTAVLPEGEQNVLYTIVQGHAVRQVVQIGLKTNDQVEVQSPALRAGQSVVVVGNHELSDGMAVSLQP